jgi:uncharacterized low-complexity protein
MTMNTKTRIALAIGSTLVAGAALAASNPFALTALDSGYQLAQADVKQKDGKCGEAKCGANKAKTSQTDKTKEASCGADKKAKEGSCGADKKMQEASCGANKKS